MPCVATCAWMVGCEPRRSRGDRRVRAGLRGRRAVLGLPVRLPPRHRLGPHRRHHRHHELAAGPPLLDAVRHPVRARPRARRVPVRIARDRARSAAARGRRRGDGPDRRRHPGGAGRLRDRRGDPSRTGLPHAEPLDAGVRGGEPRVPAAAPARRARARPRRRVGGARAHRPGKGPSPSPRTSPSPSGTTGITAGRGITITGTPRPTSRSRTTAAVPPSSWA